LVLGQNSDRVGRLSVEVQLLGSWAAEEVSRGQAWLGFVVE
ncbi:unnamed protein product, partial [Fusarium equiseti]